MPTVEREELPRFLSPMLLSQGAPPSGDGWALEVGTFAATYKMSAKDEPVSVNDKGMRLLKRQSDGAWKFALVGMK